jgi:acyl-CoA synthetase (AMP-forming)/AMP-acid ligase II
MLYDRWLEIAREFAAERALIDVPGDRTWTFAQLARAVDAMDSGPGPVFPQGNTPRFVMELLRGWRDGKVVCPVETGQAPPNLPEFSSEIRHVKMTSGTTGAPRAILFTETQIAADAANIVETMKLSWKAPNLAFISLAHSYGFSNLVTPLVLHGIPLILAGHPLPEIVKSSSKVADQVTLPAVPALWRSWSESNAIPSNIELAISAGAPLSLALESDLLARWGLKLHNFYGASECGGIAFDRTDSIRPDARIAGTALCGVSLSGGSGDCLEVQSSAVGQTYWPEIDSRLSDGRFQTNDLVEIRSDGVHILGRAGDQLNLAGRKVLPELIEEVLQQHPQIRQCAIFGIPSSEAERSEIAVAAVVVSTPVSQRDLNSFLLDRLPAWQVPRRWWFVPSLNETARGKISRRDLRNRYLAESVSQA